MAFEEIKKKIVEEYDSTTKVWSENHQQLNKYLWGIIIAGVYVVLEVMKLKFESKSDTLNTSCIELSGMIYVCIVCLSVLNFKIADRRDYYDMLSKQSQLNILENSNVERMQSELTRESKLSRTFATISKVLSWVVTTAIVLNTLFLAISIFTTF